MHIQTHTHIHTYHHHPHSLAADLATLNYEQGKDSYKSSCGEVLQLPFVVLLKPEVEKSRKKTEKDANREAKFLPVKYPDNSR